jgi:endo-1,4-beta-D-glucanase Y
VRRAWLIIAVLLPLQVFAAEHCAWSHWESFKAAYIQDGRVVDGSDTRQITTSEGQSYAMFFALVANDRASFDQLLHWTQGQLAGGDLGTYLPAWLWGRLDQDATPRSTSAYGVLDSNSASDSDLWIAYSLIEAGRLWNHYYYTSLGYLLLEQIRQYEVVDVPNLGLSILPAPKGFNNTPTSFRLNPSYAPLQILDRFAKLYPKQDWQGISDSTAKLILQSSSAGFTPDWVDITASKDSNNWSLGVGSYDAIRTYLWVGMLAVEHPERAQLLATMAPMAEATKKNAAPPEKINTENGVYVGNGPAGFSAALLPFLSQYDMPLVLAEQRQRATQVWASADGNNRYYASVLSLFGTGWDQGFYHFTAAGALVPAWQSGCSS